MPNAHRKPPIILATVICAVTGMHAIQQERGKVRAADFRQALEKMRNRLAEADRKEPEQALYY